MITALFVAPDSIYKTMDGVDAWDAARDALLWSGGGPVIAHPPCRSWSALRGLAHPLPGEHELAPWAVTVVRGWGGVLEHPAWSTLWPAMHLPPPGEQDRYGHSVVLDQYWFGHRARKRTWCYVCGVPPADVPVMPFALGTPSHQVAWSRSLTYRVNSAAYRRPGLEPRERSATPARFAKWLVSVARAVPF
jgi:hypothetical protein